MSPPPSPKTTTNKTDETTSTQQEKKENAVKTEEKTDDYQASLEKLSNEIKKELATPQPVAKPAPAPVSTNVSDPIPMDKILEEDVLMGRGKRVSEWPGNIHFRQVINRFRDDYSKAARSKKVEIAKQVMACIHEIGGRFLKENEDEVTSNANSSGGSSTTWVVVEPARAVEKTCQALREKEKARTPDKNPFTDPKKKTKLSPYTPPPSKLKSAGSCSDGEANATSKKSSDKRSASKLPKGRPRKRSKSTEEGEGNDGGGDERSEKKEGDKQKDQKEKVSQSTASKENGETNVESEAKKSSQSAEAENDEKEKKSIGTKSQTFRSTNDSHRPPRPKEEQDTDLDRRHENKETSKETKLTDTSAAAAAEQRPRENQSEKLPSSSAQQEIETNTPNEPKKETIGVKNAGDGKGGTKSREIVAEKAFIAPKVDMAAANTSKDNGDIATSSKHTLATENGTNPVAVAKDVQTPPESKSAESTTAEAAEATTTEEENSAAV